MAAHFVIRLPGETSAEAGVHAQDPYMDGAAARAAWVAVDENGALLSSPQTGTLTAALPPPGARISALVPGERVLRLRADVPVRGAGRISQALPFALEDQLADDVEDLHFAAGPREADGRVPVAVVRRDLMDRWLGQLRAAGLEPDAIYADSDALPELQGTAILLLENDRATVRDAGGEAVVLEPDSLPGLFGLWAARAPAVSADEPDAGLRHHLQVYDARDPADSGFEPWRDLGDSVAGVDVRRLPEGALPRLAAGIVSTSGINLLQGAYVRRSPLASQWPRWRPVAALAAMFVLVLLAWSVVDTWRLNREAAALDRTIAQASAWLFPDAGPADDPRRLLESRLRERGVAEQGAAGRRFLDMLAAVAGAVRQTGTARLESVNYRGGTMELQLLAPSADDLDRIRRGVMAEGTLDAEIQSANAAGDQIQGRIRIAAGNGGS